MKQASTHFKIFPKGCRFRVSGCSNHRFFWILVFVMPLQNYISPGFWSCTGLHRNWSLVRIVGVFKSTGRIFLLKRESSETFYSNLDVIIVWFLGHKSLQPPVCLSANSSVVNKQYSVVFTAMWDIRSIIPSFVLGACWDCEPQI